jgi:hypothetical protein
MGRAWVLIAGRRLPRFSNYFLLSEVLSFQTCL